MNKKIFIIILIILMLIYSINYVCADSHNKTHAIESGDSNITFANGYKGYCIEYREHSAKENDTFYIKNTSHIINQDNETVANYLKVFFTYFHNNTLHNNQGYNQTIFNQHIIWYFTDNFTSSPIIKHNLDLIHSIKEVALTHHVPDDGELRVNNTTEMIYHFRTLISPFVDNQNFLGYNIIFRNITAYENQTENETDNLIQNITNDTEIKNITNNNPNITKNLTNDIQNLTNDTDNYIIDSLFPQEQGLYLHHTGNDIILLILVLCVIGGAIYRVKK